MLTPQHSLGLIDLGSNSARLMVVRYTPGQMFKITHEFSRRVRLSEGMSGDAHLRLQPAAMERTIKTLAAFRVFCATHGIKRVIAVATAAARDAGNRAEFLAQVQAKAGVSLRVISGEEEARLSALGVTNTLGLRSGVVFEVGGGSAQMSHLVGGRLRHGVTRPLGAVRLTEMLLKSDPVKVTELRQLSEHVTQTLQEFSWLKLKLGQALAGVGGTARSLARIDREARGYPLDLVNGYELELNRLEALIAQLGALPVRERAQTPGLQSDRADIILAGAVVVAEVMRQAGAPKLLVCGHGLREGLFFEEFLKPAQPPLFDHLREFSVLNLARLCEYEVKHADQVTRLALALFDHLRHLHGLGAADRELLWAAAQLHHIGAAVNYGDPYKHTAHLILSNGLHGYTHREVAFLALLSLYLRGEKPDLALHEARTVERVQKLGTLLRLAEALEISQTQVISKVAARQTGLVVRLKIGAVGEASWEVSAARAQAELFEKVFRKKLEVGEVEKAESRKQ